ncbi:hypothetical protein ES703_99534 [subsurface metagenome]
MSGCGVSISKTGIDSHQWFGVEQPAKANKFVEAEVVMFHSGPGGIFTGWSLVPVADAVAPVVAADKVTAGPAIHRGVELFQQFQCVGAHTLDVVRRHQ